MPKRAVIALKRELDAGSIAFDVSDKESHIWASAMEFRPQENESMLLQNWRKENHLVRDGSPEDDIHMTQQGEWVSESIACNAYKVVFDYLELDEPRSWRDVYIVEDGKVTAAWPQIMFTVFDPLIWILLPAITGIVFCLYGIAIRLMRRGGSSVTA